MAPLLEADIIRFLVAVLGVSAVHLKFPNFVFFIIIPFVVSYYTLYTFLQSMRMFRGSANFVNIIMAFLMIFVLLRILYPALFVISVLYLTLVKKWPRSLLFRIGFWILLAFIYLWAYPYVVNLIANL